MRPVRHVLLSTVLLFAGYGNARSGPDVALTAVRVNFEPDSTYSPSKRPFQGIPGIERAANGRLWATWYAGGKDEGPENYVLLVTSDDGGKSWSSPVLVIDPPGVVRAFDPCLWIDPSGAMWLAWAQGAVQFDGRSGVWTIRTTNPGAANPKWSKPRRVGDGVMMNKPTVLRSGEWLFPAAMWWSVKANVAKVGEKFGLGLTPTQVQELSHDLGDRNGAHLLSTSDKGKTFRLIHGPRVPNAAFDEHMMVEEKNGEWAMYVRTSYGIGVSRSKDRGKTWTEGADTGIHHANSRFFIRRLRSGNLLLVRHDAPNGLVRSHLTAQISSDDGATWKGKLLLDERVNVSYPDGVETPNGDIHVIYDRERHRDRDILMATFREEDVLAGRCSSPKCKLRLLVNSAGEPLQR